MVRLYCRVMASADDAYQASGTVTLTDAYPINDSTNHWFGWRFQNVQVPVGATITGATLYLVPINTSNDEPDHTFWGEAADNSVAFTTAANNISGRTRTTASVSWSSADLGATGNEYWPVNAVDAVIGIVSEITSRPGWVSGNALTFVCQGSANAARDLGVIMWDSGTGGDAKLVIDYTPPSPYTGLALQVSASADDADENGVGTVSIVATNPLCDATNEWLGWRFQNVTVPKGSAILHALFSMCPDSQLNDEPNHTFYAEAADNAAQFAVSANNISNRTRTAASVLWSSADLGLNTTMDPTPGLNFRTAPDFKDLVQEVVSRGGWASGNALVLMCQGSSDANRDLGLITWDNTAGSAAKLEIVYGPAAPGGGEGGPSGKIAADEKYQYSYGYGR